MTTAPRRLGGAIRAAWAVVVLMMLGAAAWSISGLLIRWGMTPAAAWAFSVMYDAAGLICADYARRAIERNTPAGLPRLSLLAFVTVSGVLNWSHGQAIGGRPAAWGLAALSGGVELLTELHRRDVRDEQRAARGLVAERLPHIPVLGWIMYPRRAWLTLRGAVGARLDLLDPVQHEARTPGRDKAGHSQGTVRAAVRAVLDTVPDATDGDVFDQLDILGIDYDEDAVRALLDTERDTGQDAQDSRSRGTLHPIAPPGQSIADTIRTGRASGVRDRDKLVSYVRTVHGPGVRRDTIVRTINRIERDEQRSRRGA
ncbi:hypothetical protein ABT071_13845 [Streptomyces sp. NPDC002506]|uniref:hypothetical protein n=1 Tax=Streptomyces sp. NPDC002506 TaxID=3154536 RepID=UPI0033331959